MTFKRLSEYFQQLEMNTSRLKITEILADLFKECKENEIDKICYLSLGRLLPQYKGIEFQMAQKMMERAIAKAFGTEVEKVKKEMGKLGDLGEVGEKLKCQMSNVKCQKLFGEVGEIRPAFAEASTDAEALVDKSAGKDVGVIGVYERLMEIAKERGGGSVERKIDKMAVLLEDLDELSIRYVIRIPLGKMRLGFSEMTILDALSWMINRDKSLREKLEDAYNMVADIGEIARKIREIGDVRGVKNIKPKLGMPIMPALSQRLGLVEEMLEKVGDISADSASSPQADSASSPQADSVQGVAVEPKYDGQRLQLHCKQFKSLPRACRGVDRENLFVRIFTRNLENVTQMFPDLIEALEKEVKADEVILDSEGVGIDPKTKQFIPFQETIKRKRKHQVSETAKEIPLKAFVFDIMYYNGESLIQTPFWQRRKILEKILPVTNKTIILSPQIVTDDPKVMRDYHEEQVKKGLEGVMVKKINAPYAPGRRGFTWVKYKQEETKKGGGLADTIDCVVMGIYRGEGKRTDFGVGAFLVGVRKGEKIVTVSKIGTGLADEQFKQLKVQSSKFKVKERPRNYYVEKNLIPDTWCEPKIVVEIQADNITKSPIHTAGLALRFPRLVRFRDDKSAEQITTVGEVEKLFEMQFGPPSSRHSAGLRRGEKRKDGSRRK